MLYMTVLAQFDTWLLRHYRQTKASPFSEGRVSNNVSFSASGSSQNEWCHLGLTAAKGRGYLPGVPQSAHTVLR